MDKYVCQTNAAQAAKADAATLKHYLKFATIVAMRLLCVSVSFCPTRTSYNLCQLGLYALVGLNLIILIFLTREFNVLDN